MYPSCFNVKLLNCLAAGRMETVRRCPTTELASVDGPTAHCAAREETSLGEGALVRPQGGRQREERQSVVGEYQSDGQAHPSAMVPTSCRKREKGAELGEGVVGTDNEEAVLVLPREALVPF